MDAHWIGKTEVARRQLSEAVRMFFESRDPVVIHTIVASAHQILFDLGTIEGLKSALKSTEALRGEELRKHLSTINYPFNFFKHADRDPKAKINIAPLERYISDFLMDAILMLQQMTGNIPIEAKVFWSWFLSKYPQEFEDCPEGGEIREAIEQDLASLDFQTIQKFLHYWNEVDEANKSLNPDALKGAG